MHVVTVFQRTALSERNNRQGSCTAPIQLHLDRVATTVNTASWLSWSVAPKGLIAGLGLSSLNVLFGTSEYPYRAVGIIREAPV